MRSIFDAYSQPENQLTHALLCTLDADRALLGRFLFWATRHKVGVATAAIHGQSLPGEAPAATDAESERRGLPDGCVVAEDSVFLIESKFAAVPSAAQLKRHLRTAESRGLTVVSLLLLTVHDPPIGEVDRRLACKRWADVYAWMIGEAKRSAWARRFAEYMEIAEANGMRDNYLRAGQLTRFAGIPFDNEMPYSYLQAKRLLWVLGDALRQNKALARQLKTAPAELQKQKPIKGSKATQVWDLIRLAAAPKGSFTRFPHLTFGINATQCDATLTVPHGVPATVRDAILRSTFDEFQGRIEESTQNLVRVLRAAPGAAPVVIVVQRRYPSQSAEPFHDARVIFDPRTATATKARRGTVRPQPEWLRATYDALTHKHSNLQFQIGAVFPYQRCPAVRTPALVDLMAETWIAVKPMMRDLL